MKRRIFIGALLAATLAGGVYGAWGECTDNAGPATTHGEGWGPRGEFSPERRLARMARVLGLSDAQQAQIKTIFTAEREKYAPLMEKQAEYRKQLHALLQAATFDEAAVRAVAASMAQIETDLTVSRLRAQSQVNALLTPEQRALKEKLRPPMEERGPGHRPPFGGE
jgi:protein CpxP